MSGKCHVLLTNCNYSLYSLLNSALCHVLNGKFWLVRNGLSHTRHQNCVGDEIRAQDQPLQTGTHPLFCVVTSIPIRAALPFVGDWLGGDDERTLILFLRTGGCNVGLNVLCSCYYVGCWRRGEWHYPHHSGDSVFYYFCQNISDRCTCCPGADIWNL